MKVLFMGSPDEYGLEDSDMDNDKLDMGSIMMEGGGDMDVHLEDAENIPPYNPISKPSIAASTTISSSSTVSMDAVSVFVRVRPPTKAEEEAGPRTISVVNDRTLSWNGSKVSVVDE